MKHPILYLGKSKDGSVNWERFTTPPNQEITPWNEPPYPYNIGVEFTLIPDVYDPENNKCELDEYRNVMFNSSNKFKCHKDNGAFEFNYGPTKSPDKIIKYYGELLKHGKKFKLVPYRHDSYGGGFHVHIDVGSPDLAVLLLRIQRTIRAVYSRPYLNWLFNRRKSQESHQNTR